MHNLSISIIRTISQIHSSFCLEEQIISSEPSEKDNTKLLLTLDYVSSFPCTVLVYKDTVEKLLPKVTQLKEELVCQEKEESTIAYLKEKINKVSNNMEVYDFLNKYVDDEYREYSKKIFDKNVEKLSVDSNSVSGDSYIFDFEKVRSFLFNKFMYNSNIEKKIEEAKSFIRKNKKKNPSEEVEFLQVITGFSESKWTVANQLLEINFKNFKNIKNINFSVLIVTYSNKKIFDDNKYLIDSNGEIQKGENGDQIAGGQEQRED